MVYGNFSKTTPFRYAYFIFTDPAKAPGQLKANKPVIWNKGRKAVAIYKIEASVDGGGSFDLSNFGQAGAAGGKWCCGWVNKGVLKRTIND